MRNRTNILVRWFFCSLLLGIQLASGVLSATASYRLPQSVESWVPAEGEPENELATGAELVESMDTENLHISVPKCKRIKPRYYVSAFYKQYNLTAKPAGVIPYETIPDIYTPERKKGVYNIFSVFLPGYYQFLFRLSPF